MSSLVGRHNVRYLASYRNEARAYCRTTTAKPFLKSNERSLRGTEKSWAELEQAELVYP